MSYVDGLAQSDHAGVIRRTGFITGGRVLVVLFFIRDDGDNAAAVKFRHMLVQHRGQTDHRAAAVGRIHLVGGEDEEVDVFLRRFADHGEFSVRHDLRAVHDDFRAVLVGELCHAVNVGDISGHVGSGCDGHIFDLVLLEHFFKALVIHPALFIYLGIDDLAALSP